MRLLSLRRALYWLDTQPQKVHAMQARRPAAFPLKRSPLSFSLSAMLFSVLVSASAQAADNSREAIAERLKPVGELCVKGDGCAGDASAASSQPAGSGAGGQANAVSAIDGEKVYGGICMACHTTGAAGAPRLGEAGDFELALVEFRRAAELLEAALALRREHLSGTDAELAENLHHLASVLSNLGEFDRAAGLFEEALKIRRERGEEL